MDGRGQGTVTVRSLSLIIPAYNEVEVIGQSIQEADEGLSRLGCPYEILVIDDGSTDGTAGAAAGAAVGRSGVRVIRHEANRGYGAALRTGFEAAHSERVAFTDADCQFHLSDLGALLPLSDQHSLAVGYRVDRQDSWLRRLYSWGFNVVVRAALGTRVRDCDCALKVFQRDALTKLMPISGGFFVNAEMLTRARQLGYSITEAPVRHRPRQKGTSKVSPLEIPRVLRTLVPFWWTQVLFPGGRQMEGTSGNVRRGSGSSVGIALLFIAAALLFFSRLRCPLLEPDEARHAEISRQMLAAGRWTPVLRGEASADRSPLIYWLVAGSYLLLGTHDWAARLVPCSAAFCVLAITYSWGRRMLGCRAALAGALMLCLSAGYVFWGRSLAEDGLLALWTLLAWAMAERGLAENRLRWRWWLLSATACGLGMLTGGLSALALVAVPVLGYQLLDVRVPRARVRAWAAYLLLAFGLTAFGFGIIALDGPSPSSAFSWTRGAFSVWSPPDRREPFYVFGPRLLLGMFPWTLLVPPALLYLFRRSAAAAGRRPPALGFVLLCLITSLAFLTAGASDSRARFVLAMPPLALVLGFYLDVVMDRRGWRWRRTLRLWPPARLAFLTLALALAAGGGLAILAGYGGFLKPGAAAATVAASLIGLAFLLRRKKGWPVAQSWAACAATVFVFLFLGVHVVLPAYSAKFSLRAPVRTQIELASDSRLPVICYPRAWDSVSFYLQRDDVQAYGPQARPELVAELERCRNALVFVQSDGSLKDLIATLPHSLEFVVLARHEMATAGVVCPRPVVPDSLYARQ